MIDRQYEADREKLHKIRLLLVSLVRSFPRIEIKAFSFVSKSPRKISHVKYCHCRQVKMRIKFTV